jgi:hypothetical protein
MTDQPQDDHTEMNRIQLESARVDLALKNRELAEKLAGGEYSKIKHS